MGSCMSQLASSSSRSRSRSAGGNNVCNYCCSNDGIIRVVHLNGWMEEFEERVTVGQVTSKLQIKAKHFVFKQNSTTQLLIDTPPKPMEATAQLEPGNIYFLLPHSVFQMEMSPMDLVTISKRLSTIASSSPKSTATKTTPAAADVDHDHTKQQQQQQMKMMTAAAKLKTNRYAHRSSSSYVASGGGGVDTITNNNNNHHSGTLVMKKKKQLVLTSAHQLSSSNTTTTTTTWKPILESIQET